MQSGGQNAYVGIYFWNNGSPSADAVRAERGQLEPAGQLTSGPLAAGTQLKLMAVGNTIRSWQNGVQRIAVSDTT